MSSCRMAASQSEPRPVSSCAPSSPSGLAEALGDHNWANLPQGHLLRNNHRRRPAPRFNSHHPQEGAPPRRDARRLKRSPSRPATGRWRWFSATTAMKKRPSRLRADWGCRFARWPYRINCNRETKCAPHYSQNGSHLPSLMKGECSSPVACHITLTRGKSAGTSGAATVSSSISPSPL